MSFFPSLTARAFKGTRHIGPQSQALRQYAEATLGAGSLREAVKLPDGEDLTEWVAVHVVDFYNQVNMLYGTITEFCSPETCPRMTATEEYEYLWQDSSDPRFKKTTRMDAPQYIEHLMSWCQKHFDDEHYFPTKTGTPFSRNAMSLYKTMLKRLFRVYAHIYCHHFDQITELALQTHLNTSLKHFVLFVRQFDLVDDKELAPISELIQLILNENSAGKAEVR